MKWYGILHGAKMKWYGNYMVPKWNDMVSNRNDMVPKWNDMVITLYHIWCQNEMI